MNYSRTTNYKPVSGLFSLFIYHPQRFNVFYHQDIAGISRLQ